MGCPTFRRWPGVSCRPSKTSNKTKRERRAGPSVDAMKCILSHTAAYLWLMRHPNPRPAGFRASRASLAGAAMPDHATAKKLQWFLDLEDVPLDFLVATPRAMRRAENIAPHLCTRPLPVGSLIPIPSPLDEMELYCTSPELTFVQLCHHHDVLDAIFHGMSLCSDYRLDTMARSGVTYREFEEPLTTPQKIRSYLALADTIPGIQLARRALPHVHPHARSPKEIGIAMFFGLPQRLGGMALGEIHLNPCIDIFDGYGPDGSPRTSQRFPDVIAARTVQGIVLMVAFDYDSRAEHRDPWKVARDARRRNAIATVSDLTHIVITPEDAADYRYMVLTGDRARAVLKLPPWPTVRTKSEADAFRKQNELDHLRFILWRRFVQGSPDNRKVP